MGALAVIIMAIFVFCVFFPRTAGKAVTPKKYRRRWR